MQEQNISKQKIVSGASTITMQTIRIGRNHPKRNFFEKIYEMMHEVNPLKFPSLY